MSAIEQDEFRAYAVARYPQLLRTAYLLTGSLDAAHARSMRALIRTGVAWSRVGGSAKADVRTRRVLVDGLSKVPRHAMAGSATLVDEVDGQSLLATLARIDPRSRAAVVLRYYNEISDADLADALDMTPAAGQRQLRQGLAALRAAGEDVEEPDLHRALAAQAETVGEPPEVWADLRAGVAQLRRQRWLLPAVAAAVALVAGAIVVPLLSKATSPAVAVRAGAAGPRAAAGSAPAAKSLPAPEVGAAVPVYFLGAPGSGHPLYREFRNTESRDRLRAAVEFMLGPPLDPDYRTPWPAGTRLRDVRVADGTATVDVTGPALAGLESQEVCPALQQLIWTVTSTDATVSRVTLVIDGRVQHSAGPQVGCVDHERMQRRRPDDYLAAVQISTVNDGVGVRGRGRFSFGGEATLAAGTVVSWAVADVAGVVLQSGTSEVSEAAPGRGLWQAIVVLPSARAGDVVELRAAGAGPFDDRPRVDSKIVTITR